MKLFANIFAMVLSLGIASLTLSGHLQKVIHFSGSLNEIAFFMCSIILTLIFLYFTVSEAESIKERKSKPQKF